MTPVKPRPLTRNVGATPRRPITTPAVGDGAADDGEEQHGRELERREQPQPERRVRELKDQPGLRDVLHPAADLRRELGEEEAPKVGVVQGAQAVGKRAHGHAARVPPLATRLRRRPGSTCSAGTAWPSRESGTRTTSIPWWARPTAPPPWGTGGSPAGPAGRRRTPRSGS